MPEMVCIDVARFSRRAGESAPSISSAALEVNSGKPAIGAYSWFSSGLLRRMSSACQSGGSQQVHSPNTRHDCGAAAQTAGHGGAPPEAILVEKLLGGGVTPQLRLKRVSPTYPGCAICALKTTTQCTHLLDDGQNPRLPIVVAVSSDALFS